MAHLLQRRLDTLYVAYFAIHLFASICIDAQVSSVPFSQNLFPAPAREALKFYLETFKDPFLGALVRRDVHYTWFHTLVLSEVVFQVPVFVAGIIALWRDDRKIYPLLVAYGTLAASSTLQCIASLTFGEAGSSLTKRELFGLLQNYVPFFLLPAVLSIDMTFRTMRLIEKAAHVSGARKAQ